MCLIVFVDVLVIVLVNFMVCCFGIMMLWVLVVLVVCIIEFKLWGFLILFKIKKNGVLFLVLVIVNKLLMVVYLKVVIFIVIF